MTLTVEADVTHGNDTPFTVTDEAQLDEAIQAISAGGAQAAANTSYAITLAPAGGTMKFDDQLDAIDLLSGSSLTIDGQGAILDGQKQQRGFIVSGGTVTLQNLSLTDMLAQGGAGDDAQINDYSASGFAGGGGPGLGGGLFVGTGATAVLDDVAFSDDAAVGGAGATGYYGTYGFSNNDNAPGAGGSGLGGSGGAGAASGGLAAGAAAAGTPRCRAASALGMAGLVDGGGGLGAGGDVFVQEGGNLIITSAQIGAGSAVGGAAPVENSFESQEGLTPASAGQGLGGSIFIAGDEDVTLQPAAGQTVTIEGDVADQAGSSTIVVDGLGSVAAPGGYTGAFEILQGALTLTGDSSARTAGIQDNSSLVFHNTKGGSATASVPFPVITSVEFGGYFSVGVGGTGSLADVAAAINAADYQPAIGAGSSQNVYASYDAANGELTVTDPTGNDAVDTIALFDSRGNEYDLSGNPSGTFTLTPSVTLAADDAIVINGTTVQVGGTGTLQDLAEAINAASIEGVTASIATGADGEFRIVGTGTSLTLADAVGTPLETLGLQPGPQGVDESDGEAISGSGSVTVGNPANSSLILTGPVSWTGATTVSAGNTLVLQTDVSALTGAIDDLGQLIFDSPVYSILHASIAGAGAVVATGGQTLTLYGANTFQGGLTLDDATVVLASSNAAGAGSIAFMAGQSSTLELEAGVEVSNAIAGFAPGDAIDLAGFNATTTTVSVDAGGVLDVRDAQGDAATFQLGAAATDYAYAVGTAADGSVEITAETPNATATVAARTSASGQLQLADSDDQLTTVMFGGESFAIDPSLSTVVQGRWGVLAITASGAWTYYAEPNALTSGQEAADAFQALDEYGSPAQSLDLAVTGGLAATDATPITVSVAQYVSDRAALAELDNLDGSLVPIQISDTAAAISSDLATILADPQVVSVIVSDGGEVDPSLQEALTQSNLSKLSYPDGQQTGILDVSGTAAEISAELDALQGMPTIGQVSVTNDAPLTLSVSQYVSDADVLGKTSRADSTPLTLALTGPAADVIAEGDALTKDPRVVSIVVSDTSADLSNSATLSALADLASAAPGLLTIVVSDNTPVSLNVNDYQTLGNLLALVSFENGQASGLFTIADTPAAVSQAFDTLQGDASVAGIVLTTAGALTLDAQQLSLDAGLLSLTRASDGQPAAVTLTDTAADVTPLLGDLAALSKVSAIVLTDPATPTFTLTEEEWSADASALALIQSPYNLAITAAAAADIPALAQDPHVASVAVVDTAADVTGGVLDQLAEFPSASVSISDNGLSTDGYVRLSVAELLADAPALSHLTFANGSTKTLEIYDTAADIAAALDSLSVDPQIGKIVVSDNAPVAISLAQHAVDASAEQLLVNASGTPASLELTDPTVTGAATRAAPSPRSTPSPTPPARQGSRSSDCRNWTVCRPGSATTRPRTASLDPANPAYEALAPGQSTSIAVDYGVSNGDFILYSSVDWTVAGVADASLTAPGSAVHPAVPMGAPLQDFAAATLAFADPDFADTLTASYGAPSLVLSGAGPAAPAALVDALSNALTLGVVDAAGSGAGEVNASFGVTDALAGSLAPGQTLTATYEITLSDGRGGSSQQEVSFELAPGVGPFGAALTGAANSSVTIKGAGGFTLVAQYDAAGELSQARGLYADGSSDVFVYSAGVLTEEVQTHADRSKDVYFFNIASQKYFVEHIAYGVGGLAQYVDYLGVTGQAYTSYDVIYGANGKPDSATYSDGMAATWTYNPNGSYQVAYADIPNEAYSSATVQLGLNGKATSETWLSGAALYRTETWNSDGSIHDIHYYVPETFQGVPCARTTAPTRRPVSAISRRSMTRAATSWLRRASPPAATIRSRSAAPSRSRRRSPTAAATTSTITAYQGRSRGSATPLTTTATRRPAFAISRRSTTRAATSWLRRASPPTATIRSRSAALSRSRRRSTTMAATTSTITAQRELSRASAMPLTTTATRRPASVISLRSTTRAATSWLRRASPPAATIRSRSAALSRSRRRSPTMAATTSIITA